MTSNLLFFYFIKPFNFLFYNEWKYINNFKKENVILGDDYLIPVCQDKISIRSAGTDFTLRLHVEIKFHPGKVEQFST